MKATTTFLFCLISFLASGQIVNGTDTLVGNEWINFGDTYHAFEVWEDGLYAISQEELASLGIRQDDVENLRLYVRGNEVPLHLHYEEGGELAAIEFYGEKNRGELDQQLYEYSEGNVPLNPRYSLYTDTATYWLTVATNQGLRYGQSQLATGNLEGIPYCYKTEEVVYSDRHWKPIHGSDRDYIRYSNFDICEGFGKAPTRNSTVTLVSPDVFDNAGLVAEVELRIGSNLGQGPHDQTISFNNNTLERLQYSGYKVHQLSYDIASTDLSDNNTLKLEGSAATDRHVLAYAALTYPALLDARGASQLHFALDPYSGGREIRVTNFAGSDPLLIDLTDNTYLQAVADGSTVTGAIPAKGSRHEYLLVDRSALTGLTSNRSRSFAPLVSTTTDYLILSSRALIDGPENAVSQYVDYRSSNDGGSHTCEVVAIEDVIDQYGFGVEGHGLALKNFGHFLATERPNIDYLFIVGKARSYETYRTTEDRQREGLGMQVPSYGYPASDHLITALGDSPMPRIPTGRLAVESESEILTYLDKVQTYESAYLLDQTIEDKYWQKKILHLSGGSSNGTEQSSIANYLANMERKVETNSLGADVTTFYKTTSDDLQTSVSQSILNTINGGLRLLTFFGHSSQGSFDFSIEDPSKYENEGRCPLLISLGCYSGDIHTRTGSLSEDFVLEPKKGAIAFLAASGSAYLNQQGNFGNRLYELMGGEMYEASIAELVQQIASENNGVSRNDFAIRTMLQQFTLHGDPALRLNYESGPDYVLDYRSAKTSPEIISTSGDITFSVDVVNLGKYNENGDSIALEIVHNLPNGEVADTLSARVPAVSSRETVDIVIRNPGVNGVGRNTVKGRIDAQYAVDELPAPAAENNNQLRSSTGNDEYEFYILDNSIRPIYPENYSIVNTSDFRFAASTANVFQGEETYMIEVDTAATFDSPTKYSDTKTVAGGTVEWNIPLNWSEGTVYYWRVSPIASSTETGQPVWQSASFIYLPNSSEGWNQSHYYQWLENVPNGTMRIDSNRQFKMQPDANYLKIVNNTRRHLSRDQWPQYIGNTFGNWGRMWIWEVSSPLQRSGISVTVLKGDEDYWLVPPGGRAGSLNRFNNIILPHAFSTETREDRSKLITFLMDSIPDNYYAIIYSNQWSPNHSYHVEEWAGDEEELGRSLFDAFESLGITGTRILEDRGSVPFIFMCQKGTGEVYRNVIAQTAEDEIEAQWEFPRVGQEGVFTSPRIGPAQVWDRMLWEEEIADNDSTVVIISGSSSREGNYVPIDTVHLDYEVDLRDVDASIYPYLQLELQSYDPARSAGQLQYWRVLFTGSPEGTFCVDGFHADTLEQGEVLELKHTIKNISSYDLDSVLMQYDIVNQENERVSKSERLAPLSSGESQAFTFRHNTEGLVGDQVLSVELNPGQDQVEAYAFNNVGLKRFYVKRDARNPDLDITFDGIRIMNGDYVSSEPEIVVYLQDDNRYLMIDDTSSFELRLNSIDDPSLSEDIFISDERVIFEPATSAEEAARLTFRPTLEDGRYELQVQGRDASGNFSGSNNRAVEFRVENQSRISNVYNYPNPFSTSTQFVFMLTGSTVPDDMAIQIMTMSGKVVREITAEELGPLQIGLNRSTYKWDGRDEYGSPLANGVYLYRVLSSHRDEEEIQHFETARDDLFKEGFGKMVIMR